MAGTVGVRLEVNLSAIEAAKKALAAKPAAVRRVVRNALARTTRASARRVKGNLLANRRTRLLEQAVGQKVVTYGEAVVGLVGPRHGFRQVVKGLGPVNPAKYDKFVEKGRKPSAAAAKGKKYLALQFRNLSALYTFLDKFPKQGMAPPSRSVGKVRFPQYPALVRRYGRDIANLVRPNENTGAAGGFVVFLRKVGAAKAFNPVARDEGNLIRESEQAVTSDLRQKFGG